MPKQNGNPKILAAGAAVQLLTGIPAAWGVFQKPVMAQYGFSRGQAMLSFAILVAGYGIGCAIGGFVQDQHGPRYAALWGTALLGGGSAGSDGDVLQNFILSQEMVAKVSARLDLPNTEAAGDDVSRQPAFDMKLGALTPVLRGQIPLKAHAHRADDILTALRIA